MRCGNDVVDRASFCSHCGSPTDPPAASVTGSGSVPKEAAAAGAPVRATIVDFKIPFVSMVVLMVKLAIAAIPAAFIVTLLYMVFFIWLAGIGGGTR